MADLSPEFLRIRRKPLYVDDLHPNADGQRLIAEAIARQIGLQLDAELSPNAVAPPGTQNSE